jgi:ferredoxin
MRIRVSAERCVSSGQCVMLAPEVFDQDDDGIVVLLTDRPDDSEAAAVRESTRVCPSLAITIED